jgi:hypothetical protein
MDKNIVRNVIRSLIDRVCENKLVVQVDFELYFFIIHKIDMIQVINDIRLIPRRIASVWWEILFQR